MFRKTRIVLALSAAAFIAGCTSSQPTWRKEGVDAHGMRSAHAECRYQVGLNKVPENKQRALINDCMEGKGFRLRR